MKRQEKVVVLAFALAIIAVPLSSRAWVNLDFRGELGTGIVNPAGGGLSNLYAGTQWGVGGGLELSLKFIGLGVDFIYHRDYDANWGLKGVTASNNLRIPLNLRFHLPGVYLSAGPEWRVKKHSSTLLLDLSLGTSIPLGIASLVFETPKLSVNWWSNSEKILEIKIAASLYFKIF